MKGRNKNWSHGKFGTVENRFQNHKKKLRSNSVLKGKNGLQEIRSPRILAPRKISPMAIRNSVMVTVFGPQGNNRIKLNERR